jgi:hypothetical protein
VINWAPSLLEAAVAAVEELDFRFRISAFRFPKSAQECDPANSTVFEKGGGA